MKAKKRKEHENWTWAVYDSKENLLFTTTELEEAINYMETHPEAARMRSNLHFGGIFD